MKNLNAFIFAGNLFSFIFTMYYLRNFLFAYLFGLQTGSYRNTIDINLYNEANIELVPFVVAGAVVFATTVYTMLKLSKSLKKGNKQATGET